MTVHIAGYITCYITCYISTKNNHHILTKHLGHHQGLNPGSFEYWMQHWPGTCHNVPDERSKLIVFCNIAGSGSRVTTHFSTSTLTLQDMVMIGPQKDVAIILDVFGACWATCDPQLGLASCTGANHDLLRPTLCQNFVMKSWRNCCFFWVPWEESLTHFAALCQLNTQSI